MPAEATRLPDGRLHLHHGPIDIIAQSWGDAEAVRVGEARAIARFDTILAELASELPILRAQGGQPCGAVAQTMARATGPYYPRFITPMAAVAGAVADEILRHLCPPGVTRAYVNNGGDIAVHLTPGESLTCAIAARPGAPDRIILRAQDSVRGIATSGWRGRSHSLGIADGVTVLARTAAMADAAATMIANAVDLPGHAAITRRAACDLQADSDLGARLVTTAVGPLSSHDIARALNRGEVAARPYLTRGLIDSVALFLHAEIRTLGPRALTLHAPTRKEPALA